MPNSAAAADPKRIPRNGAHSRSAPPPRRATPAMTASVEANTAGPAYPGAPAGRSASAENTIGITVTAISMITVPATTGVMTRRSQDRREARANWKSEEATTRVARSPGPPSTRAVTETAMKTPEVPMSRMCPAPIRPTRLACSTVVTPLTASAANTAHDR